MSIRTIIILFSNIVPAVAGLCCFKFLDRKYRIIAALYIFYFFSNTFMYLFARNGFNNGWLSELVIIIEIGCWHLIFNDSGPKIIRQFFLFISGLFVIYSGYDFLYGYQSGYNILFMQSLLAFPLIIKALFIQINEILNGRGNRTFLAYIIVSLLYYAGSLLLLGLVVLSLDANLSLSIDIWDGLQTTNIANNVLVSLCVLIHVKNRLSSTIQINTTLSTN